MAEGTGVAEVSGGGAPPSAGYTPYLETVEAADFFGAWKLLCARPREGEQPTLMKVGVVEFGPGVVRVNSDGVRGPLFVVGDQISFNNASLAVFGALMKDRKGLPWLTVGKPDGTDVTRVLYNPLKVTKVEAKVSWPSSEEFEAARERANAAAGQLALLGGERAAAAAPPASAATGGHLLDGLPLTKHRLEAVAPELNMVAVSVAEWKEKEGLLHDLQRQVQDLKRRKREREPRKEGQKSPRESPSSVKASSSSSSSSSPSPRRSKSRSRSHSRRRSKSRSRSKSPKRHKSRSRSRSRSPSRSKKSYKKSHKKSRHHRRSKSRSRSRRSRSRSKSHEHKSGSKKKK